MSLLLLLKALADENRLRLAAVLARGEFTVQELTAILAQGQSRISHHLKALAEAKVVTVKRQGRSATGVGVLVTSVALIGCAAAAGATSARTTAVSPRARSMQPS